MFEKCSGRMTGYNTQRLQRDIFAGVLRVLACRWQWHSPSPAV
ncbi:MAG: hypothetical protein U0V70_08985 [Terriglobia bacterium]